MALKLEEFDAFVPTIRAKMQPTDIAMIVADHGVDPHHRQHRSLARVHPAAGFRPDRSGTTSTWASRGSFADVAATIAKALAVTPASYRQEFPQGNFQRLKSNRTTRDTGGLFFCILSVSISADVSIF